MVAAATAATEALRCPGIMPLVRAQLRRDLATTTTPATAQVAEPPITSAAQHATTCRQGLFRALAHHGHRHQR